MNEWTDWIRCDGNSLDAFNTSALTWKHIVIVSDGSRVKVYENAHKRLDFSGTTNHSNQLVIGDSRYNGRYFKGKIDNVRVYNRAITNEEVRALFELGETGMFRVTNIYPTRGGNTGAVSIYIHGEQFVDGTIVKLVRGGEEIIGNSTSVSTEGHTIKATFDLRNRAQGLWDVEVTNPSGTSQSLVDGFTIEEGREAQIWVDIIGRNTIRAGRAQQFTVIYGNRGNIDAIGALLWVTGIPKNAEVKTRFDYSLIEEEVPGDSSIVAAIEVEKIIPLLITSIPASYAGALNIELTVPNTAAFKLGIFTVTTAQEAPINNAGNKTSHLLWAANLKSTNPSSLTPQVFAWQWLLSFPEGSEKDVPALRDILSIANFRSFGLNPLCFADAKRIADAFKEACTTQGNTKLKGWTVRTVEVAGINKKTREVVRGCHAALIVSSPPPEEGGTGKHYYIDKYLTPFLLPDDIVEMRETGSGKWKPISRLSKAALALLVCKPFLQAIEWVFTDRVIWPDDVWFQETHAADPYTVKFTCPSTTFQFNSAGAAEKKTASVSGQCPTAEEGISFPIDVVGAIDPNDKIGSRGAGEAHFLSSEEPLRYIIYFENLATATAPAQEVFITDTLDVSNLNLESLSLDLITFSRDGLVKPLPGLSEFSINVDLRPKMYLILRIKSKLDKATGVIKWTFESLDPETLELTQDPLAGFLPPNINPPEGEGSVLFNVMPKSGLPTGTTISNQASIFFDTNAPIKTPVWHNKLDTSAPTSQVVSLLSTEDSTGIVVQWDGSDEGSGISDYSIFVSEEGGDFVPWIVNTTNLQDTISIDPQKFYAFYSIARDRTGNFEKAPQTPDATTDLIGGGIETFALHQNYPNPFNLSTDIAYELPNNVRVILKVYNILGREIEVLVDEEKKAGRYKISWKPSTLVSGLYFYQIKAGDFSQTKKMLLLK